MSVSEVSELDVRPNSAFHKLAVYVNKALLKSCSDRKLWKSIHDPPNVINLCGLAEFLHSEIILNQPFRDGNKRTSLCILFLFAALAKIKLNRTTMEIIMMKTLTSKILESVYLFDIDERVVSVDWRSFVWKDPVFKKNILPIVVDAGNHLSGSERLNDLHTKHMTKEYRIEKRKSIIVFKLYKIRYYVK